MQCFGVDIGGSGIKGAIVDVSTGELVGDRHRIVTPQPATPDAVARARWPRRAADQRICWQAAPIQQEI